MSNIVSINGYAVHYIEGAPTITDLDLAGRLGYAEPRAIRKLIKRMLESGQIQHSQVRMVEVEVPRNCKPVVEFLLSAQACISVVMAAETKGASTARSELMRLFVDADAVINAIKTFEVPDDLPDMYVYAIREKDTGNIKLGISRDPEARLRQLQTGNSSELELVAFRKAENRFADERALHADAEAYRLRGEWFEGAAVDALTKAA